MKLRLFRTAIICTFIAGCGQSEPRGTQYFELQIDEARQIVAGCTDGSVRGGECENANRAVNKADAKERRKRFLGDGKAYKEEADVER